MFYPDIIADKEFGILYLAKLTLHASAVPLIQF